MEDEEEINVESVRLKVTKRTEGGEWQDIGGVEIVQGDRQDCDEVIVEL